MRQVGIFGKRSSGKSALMYALTKSEIIGAAKFSSMEISGVGKIMLVDTVGVDVENSTAEKSAESIELALLLISDNFFELELAWLSKLKKTGAKVIVAVSRADIFPDDGKSLAAAVAEVSGINPVRVSTKTGLGMETLAKEIINKLSAK